MDSIGIGEPGISSWPLFRFPRRRSSKRLPGLIHHLCSRRRVTADELVTSAALLNNRDWGRFLYKEIYLLTKEEFGELLEQASADHYLHQLKSDELGNLLMRMSDVVGKGLRLPRTARRLIETPRNPEPGAAAAQDHDIEAGAALLRALSHLAEGVVGGSERPSRSSWCFALTAIGPGIAGGVFSDSILAFYSSVLQSIDSRAQGGALDAIADVQDRPFFPKLAQLLDRFRVQPGVDSDLLDQVVEIASALRR